MINFLPAFPCWIWTSWEQTRCYFHLLFPRTNSGFSTHRPQHVIPELSWTQWKYRKVTCVRECVCALRCFTQSHRLHQRSFDPHRKPDTAMFGSFSAVIIRHDSEILRSLTHITWRHICMESSQGFLSKPDSRPSQYTMFQIPCQSGMWGCLQAICLSLCFDVTKKKKWVTLKNGLLAQWPFSSKVHREDFFFFQFVAIQRFFWISHYLMALLN